MNKLWFRICRAIWWKYPYCHTEQNPTILYCLFQCHFCCEPTIFATAKICNLLIDWYNSPLFDSIKSIDWWIQKENRYIIFLKLSTGKPTIAIKATFTWGMIFWSCQNIIPRSRKCFFSDLGLPTKIIFVEIFSNLLAKDNWSHINWTFFFQ